MVGEQERGLRGVLFEIAVHMILLIAVCFALYPILWVVSLALSPAEAPEARVLPIPAAPSLDNFVAVVTNSDEGTWLFGWQLFNSVTIALATSLVAIAIATPAAYALARFDFVGKEGSTKALLATQMFPGVAAAIPLYLLLSWLHLLDTRSGLVLVYATSAVPFAIFQ
ncbi:MAG: sugar ABC transporter permease, partial [Sandaracinaceae bacterium]|nr:sugar ABC transporter permease [Sandaracinaceae bacterium]